MKCLSTVSILPVVFGLIACGGKESDSASEAEPSSVSRVTVGTFIEQGGDFVDKDADLTYEVGASCQIWARSSQEHGDPPPAGHEGSHDHWNAADGSTYEDGVFTWTEYGPFLTEAEIADACGAGSNPSDPKSVTADDYTEFQEGLFLRIKSVE